MLTENLNSWTDLRMVGAAELGFLQTLGQGNIMSMYGVGPQQEKHFILQLKLA